ncbi:MAG: methyltransferase domain-containing protein [Betaproteobacteria bacterium]
MESVAKSASVVVPLVAKRFQPKSVLDVGCGTGDWLREFLIHGAEEVLGYDGEWVPRTALKIPEQCFHAVEFYAGFPAARRVDLAMCREVAEHVEESVGQTIVEFLCTSSDVVLWSAAVPGQTGYAHINLRYPEHWMAHFKARGFDAFDLFRAKIWLDDRVSWWYQQNLMVFASAAGREKHSLVSESFVPLLVHPTLYERVRDPRHYSLRQITRHLPVYLMDRLRQLWN